MPKKVPQQLASEADRSILRDYLTKRMKRLHRAKKRAPEDSDAYYVEGAEMEILMLFDELLGEEGPLND